MMPRVNSNTRILRFQKSNPTKFLFAFTLEIVELGSGVTGLQKGQRATASTTMACGKCFYCKRGDFLECENLDGIGVEINGAFAEYIKLRADLVFPIEKLSTRESVMVEPTACAVHGMQTLAMKPASKVLLFGAGPTGQVLAQLLKLNGATHLTVAAPAVPSLESGKVKVDEIVTHEIPLRDYKKPLDLAFAREAIKIAIIP